MSTSNSKAGCLYIIATPIGNLADMTTRAVLILKQVQLIAAEDTRHSKPLLMHYDIQTPCISLHDFNESHRVEMLLSRLKRGEDIALISDAGTPLISDPGYRLVDAVINAGIQVIPLPGACAAISALVASGLPTDRFVFEGFLPQKGTVRRKRLEALVQEERTIIFYESPHRILDLLELLELVFGAKRIIVVARELTKKFETIRRGTVDELRIWMQKNLEQQKGEFVIMVHGVETHLEAEQIKEYQRILTILLSELPTKQAIHCATKITGANKNFLYEMALEIKKSDNDSREKH